MVQNFEDDFWYVIHSAGYFADTIEKRYIFAHMLTNMVHLFPVNKLHRQGFDNSNPKPQTFYTYNKIPLYEKDVATADSLNKWIYDFRSSIQRKFSLPTVSNDPKKFGPHWWTVIHSAASASVTPELRFVFATMMKNLVRLIPCSQCCEHATAFIDKKTPVEFYCNSYDDLFYWTFLFHEYANDNTGCPNYKRLSYDQACRKYIQ